MPDCEEQPIRIGNKGEGWDKDKEAKLREVLQKHKHGCILGTHYETNNYSELVSDIMAVIHPK